MRKEVMEFEWVKPDELKPAGFNPVWRTDIKNDDPLLRSIRENGFLPYRPVLLSKDGRIGDGHRRVACCEILGLEVYVQHTSATVEELWAQNVHKAPTTKDWDAVSLDGGVRTPAKVSKFHEELESLCGPHALSFLREYGKSSRIVVYLRRLLAYLGITPEQKECYKYLQWMVVLNQQRPLIEAMRDNISPAILKQAIKENKPLKRGNWTT